MPVLAGYGRLERESNFRRLASDMLAMIDTQLGAWKTVFDDEGLLEDVTQRSFASLLEYLYKREADSLGKSISFVKDNGNILWPLHLQAMFENSKFVYLVRDPRDVALSWLKSPTHVGGVSSAAATWQAEQRSALAAYALEGVSTRILLVKYEDLVAMPTVELDRICEFIGIEPETSMIGNFENESHRAEAQKIANWENLAGEIKQTNFGKFERELSKGKIRRVEGAVAYEMQILDYERTQVKASRVPPWSFLGKLYRASISSLRLFFGGRKRREELAVRIRRLKVLHKIRRDVMDAPESLIRDRDADADG